MNENFRTREKQVLISEVCNLRSGGTKDPEELYRFIADSFGKGFEERYKILSVTALTGEPLKHTALDIDDLASQFMSQLNSLSPSPLGVVGSFERELFSNLLKGKLAVEVAEVKRARLTSDPIGQRADILWMEEQAQAMYPNEDEQSKLAADLASAPDAGVLSKRKAELAAVVEEWVLALERYDLALRELQLEPEESVTERFASFQRRVPAPLDRGKGNQLEVAVEKAR